MDTTNTAGHGPQEGPNALPMGPQPVSFRGSSLGLRAQLGQRILIDPLRGLHAPVGDSDDGDNESIMHAPCL